MTLLFPCQIQGIEDEGRRRSLLFGNVTYFDNVSKSIISVGFGQYLVAKTIVVVMVVDVRKTETFEKRTIYKLMLHIILLLVLTSANSRYEHSLCRSSCMINVLPLLSTEKRKSSFPQLSI
jgi:hypothetical protein